MRLPDSFSFRRRPSGLFKILLRVPVWLFRARLGFLFGDRILLISHVGRNSGRLHQTLVEVVVHDRQAGEYLVCSGTGKRADWYRNLTETPAPQIQVGNDRWAPRQRFLSSEEAANAFAAYERANPSTAHRLLESMGNSYDGSDFGRLTMMEDMPMVAFSDKKSGVPPNRNRKGLDLVLIAGLVGRKRFDAQQPAVVVDGCHHMGINVGVHTTSNSYDSHRRPFLLLTGEGVVAPPERRTGPG